MVEVDLVLETICENLPLATVVSAGFVEHTAPRAAKLLNDEKIIINIIPIKKPIGQIALTKKDTVKEDQ